MNHDLKILQIIPNLGCGGAEHFVCDLALEMNSQGFQCDILTLYDIEEENPIYQRLAGKVAMSSLHKRPGFQPSCFHQVLDFVKAGGYDIVNAHLGAIKYLFLVCLLLRRVRCFATIHSDAVFEAGGSMEKYIRKFMFRSGLCRAVTISKESDKSFSSLYHTGGALIYNGVSDYIPSESHTPIRRGENDIIFFHPASCQEVKNQELLFRAFKRLEAICPDVYLFWAGSSEMHKDLFESLKPLIDGHISYLGTVENVRDYLCESDAMCLASRLEGMPITVIEAFSVGCVPICTPVGGCRDVIEDGYNGLLSDSVGEDAYFVTLKRFVEMSDDRRAALRRHSAGSFDRYNIHSCVSEYIKLYRNR